MLKEQRVIKAIGAKLALMGPQELDLLDLAVRLENAVKPEKME